MVIVDGMVRITGEQHPHHGFVRVSKTSDLVVIIFFLRKETRLTTLQDA